MFVRPALAQSVEAMIRSCKTAIEHLSKGSYPETGVAGIGIGSCLGMAKGTMDAVFFYEAKRVREKAICIPENASISQVARVFVSYAERNPADHHLGSSALFLSSLFEAFPCKK